jgi:hypothetical protein
LKHDVLERLVQHENRLENPSGAKYKIPKYNRHHQLECEATHFQFSADGRFWRRCNQNSLFLIFPQKSVEAEEGGNFEH